MIKDKLILRIAVPTPLQRSFDYLMPKDWLAVPAPGARILIPFGKQQLVGILLETDTDTAVPAKQLKSALTLLDHTPLLSTSLLSLLRWASQYYQHPIGEVVQYALPPLLRRPTLSKKMTALLYAEPEANAELKPLPTLPLNPAQQQAVTTILQRGDQFHCFLLDGVTGSGKTEVYLAVLQQVLATGKQALVLVPEIGLTPQTIARFAASLPYSMAVLHSNLTENERLQTWLDAKNGAVKLIIGTRSAVFTEFANLGVIVVDEEHDLSYKQQDNFRYSARDLAIRRAQLLNVPIILGSATPSLESLQNALSERYQLLNLPERAGGAIPPQFQLVDLRGQQLASGLAPTTLTAMRQHLEREQQVLLFLNRRGFATVLLCHECGWTANCPRCDTPFTLHDATQRLQCHHCAKQQRIPEHCPECKHTQLLPLGVGTERLETHLTKLLPDIEIIRIDRDTTRRKNSLEQKLETVTDGKKQILIGTQMLAKGHHFPNVTLVVVLNADNGLFSTDFRAAERIGQLLIQVAGRAGRATQPGKVLIQTYQPDHPLLNTLIDDGYNAFAQQLLIERQAAQLPPFAFLALLRAESTEATAPERFLLEVKQWCLEQNNSTIKILGPIAAPMPKRAGKHRAQLLLQTGHRTALQTLLATLRQHLETLKTARQVRWSLDIDPQELS